MASKRVIRWVYQNLQFASFQLLYKYGKRTRDFGAFLFLLWSSSLQFGGVFNKTNMSLALDGYEIIIANLYPTRARGIIVN